MFIKYQHVENDLKSLEVDGLLDGDVIIQPKLDGSNASVWFEDGSIHVASRSRELSISSDNQECYLILHKDSKLRDYFAKYPTHRLYGEWLVPHHVKYEDSAWKKFYIFDVYDENGVIPYNEIIKTLESYGLNCVPYTQDKHYTWWENYLNPTTAPEGMVIKNYGYRNTFGRQTWCKVINPEFKKVHIKQQKEEINPTDDFINKYVSEFEIEKEYLKHNHKNIGEFIRNTQYTIIDENIADYIYQHKGADINFYRINKAIQQECLNVLRKYGELKNG